MRVGTARDEVVLLILLFGFVFGWVLGWFDWIWFDLFFLVPKKGEKKQLEIDLLKINLP